MSDTIVAIATSAGVGSISIVRVSGKDAKEIAKKIAPKASLKPRYAELCSLYDAKESLIDRGIVIYFQAPNSFTGEDIVEFQCHGGLVIAQEILEATIKAGATLAKPGEFSKRAFLNGKIDLSEAEAIAKLIEAKSVDAVRILAKQLKGQLKEFIKRARESILYALSYSEVMIDYAEEDLDSNLIDNLKDRLSNLSKEFEQISESSRRRKGLIEGFKVAIVGKPNVGKSSLLNSLLSYERAIVSDIAGTTRDTIEEFIKIGSHLVKIVDTAGIRDLAKDKIEQIGIERSLNSVKEADIIIALFDLSRPLDREDEKILELLKSNKDKEILVALNKSDLKQELDTSKLREFNPIRISTKKEPALLIDRLKEILDSYSVDEELILSSSRQIEAVSRAKEELELSLLPLDKGELELFSYHLQNALEALSEITRPYRHEEILDKMFSEFCLGK